MARARRRADVQAADEAGAAGQTDGGKQREGEDRGPRGRSDHTRQRVRQRYVEQLDREEDDIGGAERAREVAGSTLARVYERLGFLPC